MNDINSQLMSQGDSENFEDNNEKENSVEKKEGEIEREVKRGTKAKRESIDIKNEKKDKSNNKIELVENSLFKISTSKILQQMWLWLIPSFGLSLIFINLHVLLSHAFGNDKFCKLGEEWSLTEQMTPKPKDQSFVSKNRGIFESMGLVSLDLIFLFSVLAVITLIIIVVYGLTHKTEMFFEIVKDKVS